MKPRKFTVEYAPEEHDKYKRDFKITTFENAGMSSVQRLSHEELIDLCSAIQKHLLVP